ncbi:efflux RND transporter periplasmic adaptor subunit [Legionella nagasakiensis]|uniref:efflux RND transporter periplasmic adaptor subunit n=1 Tax=Legionella nagasakiensis TaxID=535290 RepID=UPI001A951546|nr:efflux RND transporter periplasmic adaptor subunit [Legionella nagasakiensis]
MKKRMIIMLLCVGILFGGIFIYKIITGFLLKTAMEKQSKIPNVATMKVGYSQWQPKLLSSGSVRAIRGVDVTTQLAGMVQTIYFKPGAMAQENELLVQLNADNDIAQLHALEANAELAKITYLRDKAQYAIHAVSKQTLDNDAANLKSLQAQVAQQAAIVDKKSIRAPFAGHLGINNVNPGQFINPGDKVVTLQTLDPIYIDFYIPQQKLAKLQIGQDVIVTSDAYPRKTFHGKITTINPALDVGTRNVEVEATLANPKNQLMPGMFGTVEIIIGKPSSFITVPQTAISFNPYGDIVYILKESGKDKQSHPILIATQHFVTTGETRGEQIQVLKGLQKGDEIVTSGQLKLKNGSRVAINNSIALPNNPDPELKNNH